jgi:hypothetical protein
MTASWTPSQGNIISLPHSLIHWWHGQLDILTTVYLMVTLATTMLLCDVDRDAWDYMRKKGRDVEVEPPGRMTTSSQTRAAAEDQKQSSLELRLIADWPANDRRTWAQCPKAIEEATDGGRLITWSIVELASIVWKLLRKRPMTRHRVPWLRAHLRSIAPVLRLIAHGVLCYFFAHLLTAPTLVSLFE